MAKSWIFFAKSSKTNEKKMGENVLYKNKTELKFNFLIRN